MRQLSLNQKPRILYVITKSNWGGAQRYVYDLVTRLPRDSFEVSVALGGNGPLKTKLEDVGIRTILIPSLVRDVHLVSDVGAFFWLLKFFIKERPQVLHLNSSKIGGFGALAGRIVGVPKIIFTAHGWAFNEARPVWQKVIIKLLARITVVLSHQTIAVSEAVKNDIGHFPGSQKIVVIRNGTDIPDFLSTEEALSKFEAVSTAFTERYRSHSPKYIVGSVAELHPVKNLDVAIDAIATLPTDLKIKMVYVVLGEGEERKKLEQQIISLELTQTVFLLGFMPDAPKYLKAFDVFILPSHSEALALSILEAGVAELPVIATRVGGISEIIENHKDGILVPPENVAALAGAIEKLLDNDALRQTLGANLKQTVTEKFSLEKMVEETLELYR